MIRASRFAGPLAAMLALLLALSGCTASASAAEADRTLKWGWRLPSTWDSAKGIGYDVHVLSLVHSGLTRLGPDGSVQPDLAQSWEYNEAGDAVTFRLRPGLTFSDGAAVDASAIKTSLERGRDTDGSTAAQSLAIIEDIEVESELDVTLHLAKTSYQVPLLLAGLIGHIVSPDAIAGDTPLNLQPVGAGPFVLDSYEPGSQATLSKNPDHWNADAIKLEHLQVLPAPAPAVTLAGLSSGQYDIAHVAESQIGPLEDAGFRIDAGPVFNVHTLQINNRHKPFDDERVVRAINHAIDRDAIVDSVLFGHGEPDWQPFARGQDAYSDDIDRVYDTDIDEAKRLLAEAGFPDGFEVKLHLLGDANSGTSQKIGEVLQSQLAEVGIRVNLEIAPPGAGTKAAHSYTLHMYSFSGRESPVQALEVLYDDAGWMNISQTEPEGFDAALQRAREIPIDDPEYPEAIQDATELAVTGLSPHAFIATWHRAHAMNDRVHGFAHHVHTQRFENVELEESRR